MSEKGSAEGKRPVFLTPKQVAERYQLSVQWVYHCKDLEPYKRKIGRYVRFLESDLERFEQERVGKAGPGYDGTLFIRRADKWKELQEAAKPKIRFTM